MVNRIVKLIGRLKSKRTAQDLAFSLKASSYFPEILPPIFSSTSFAAALRNRNDLPPWFVIDWSKQKSLRAELITFTFRRPGNQRRVFALPNPIPFNALVEEMVANWKDVREKAVSSCAASSPHEAPHPDSQSAIQPRISSVVERARKLRIRIGKRYIVHADVTRFYPSVYTHTYVWAVDGKESAKKKPKDKSLLGNRIDGLIQDCQDGQTVGLPIGQDVFRIVAETILASVDRRLGLTEENCYRYSDDYEIACVSLAEAEKYLSALERELHEYGLAINHSKSGIKELPEPFVERWITELLSHSVESARPGNLRRQESQIARLFDAAYRLSKEYQKAPTVAYAITCLPGWDSGDPNELNPELLELVLKYLSHAIVAEPGCASRAYRYLVMLKTAHPNVVESGSLKTALSTVLRGGLNLGLESDVIWALFGFIVFNIPVPKNVDSSEVYEGGNTLVRTMMIACHLAGVWKLSFGLFAPLLKGEWWKGRNWLVVYELARHRLNGKAVEIVSKREQFAYLIDAGVDFLRLKDLDAALLETKNRPGTYGDLRREDDTY